MLPAEVQPRDRGSSGPPPPLPPSAGEPGPAAVRKVRPPMLRLRRAPAPGPGPGGAGGAAAAAAMGLLNFTQEPVPEAVSGDMHNLNQLSAQVGAGGRPGSRGGPGGGGAAAAPGWPQPAGESRRSGRRARQAPLPGPVEALQAPGPGPGQGPPGPGARGPGRASARSPGEPQLSGAGAGLQSSAWFSGVPEEGSSRGVLPSTGLSRWDCVACGWGSPPRRPPALPAGSTRLVRLRVTGTAALASREPVRLTVEVARRAEACCSPACRDVGDGPVTPPPHGWTGRGQDGTSSQPYPGGHGQRWCQGWSWQRDGMLCPTGRLSGPASCTLRKPKAATRPLTRSLLFPS